VDCLSALHLASTTIGDLPYARCVECIAAVARIVGHGAQNNNHVGWRINARWIKRPYRRALDCLIAAAGDRDRITTYDIDELAAASELAAPRGGLPCRCGVEVVAEMPRRIRHSGYNRDRICPAVIGRCRRIECPGSPKLDRLVGVAAN